MAVHPLSWLLRLAVLCHLALLLAGQHYSMDLCSFDCEKMTSEIPRKLLASYRRTEPSCRTPAIILTTRKNRTFCADPKEDWVQEAMKHLDHSLPQERERTEKQVDPRIPPATRATDRSPASEPTATTESSSQVARGPSGTSPKLPQGMTDSWGNMSAPTSPAPDGGPSSGPERTELFNAAATATTTTTTTTTPTSWQSSFQPTVDLGTEGKAFETASTQAPSTQALSTQTLSTQALSTQALPTQALSTQALPTQTLSTQALSTQALPTDIPSTQTPSTQALPTDISSTQAPSTQALPTDTPSTQAGSIQTPSPQAPTISHTAPDHGQDLTPKNPLGSSSAHADAVTGPGSTPRVSVAPSREPVATGSWAPTPKNPQRLGILSTPVTEATRRQAVGLLAFLGLLFCLGVAMFTYQRLQGCPRSAVGDMVEGLRYVPRGCGSNSYVLVPV